MDIEEVKKFAKNKIEADDITKQVRDIIKITKWQKQDMREGFKETFQPLIESQDSIKKSIDDKQNKTLEQLQANQLALTQGLNQNRLAITQGLENLIYQPVEKDEASGEASGEEKKREEIRAKKLEENEYYKNYLDRYLNFNERIEILKNFGYTNLPSYFINEDVNMIEKIINDVNYNLEDIKSSFKNSGSLRYNKEGYLLMYPLNKNPQKQTLINISDYNALATYSKNLSDLFNSKNLYKKKLELELISLTTHIKFLKDLNYLVYQFLLGIMV